MQTFKANSIPQVFALCVLTLAIIAISCVIVAKNAYAFDPKKVFKEEKPSHKKLFQHYLKKKRKGASAEAIDVLKYAAEQGSQTAMWKLGRMHELGDGVQQNEHEAFLFYKQIADRYGEALPNKPEWRITGKAMVALGHYYKRGIPSAGIAPDPEEAQVMFTTSAMYFRDPDAQFELGKMLLEREVTVDSRQAIMMLNLSRKNGHTGALALLGHALVQGEYVQQDVIRGLTMLTRAVKRAPKKMRNWIAELQQDAFSIASEEERQLAIRALR